MVLAEHFEVHAKRGPAHAEVRLPLHLHMPAGDRQREFLASFVVESDRAIGAVDGFHRHIENVAGVRMDRQERAVGRLAFLAQRRQHHVHDLLILLCRALQHLVKAAGFVAFRCRQEFVFEAELVEEGAETRIHVLAIGLMRAERVRHSRQRHLQIGLQLFRVRHGRRHLAHAVHVVGHADQARRDLALRQHFKRMAHHGRADHFAERADVRQA